MTPAVARSNAALLSLLICPGLGQLDQGRRTLGHLQLAFAILGVLALWLAPAFGMPRVLPALDLAALAL